MSQKVFFDCDPGIDDALALQLLAASPDVELVGVSTVCGNVNVDSGTRNALALLEQSGCGNVPVARGCARFLDHDYDGGVPHIHGPEGSGYATLETTLEPARTSGPQLLIDTVRAHPGEIDIIAVGPLTNLAVALIMAPDIADKARSLHIMGGAFWQDGNVAKHGEANIWNDPLAASIVFDAPWCGYIAPLDATMRTRLEKRHVEQLASSSSQTCRTLADVLKLYCEFHSETVGFYGAILHDPLAVAAGIGMVRPNCRRGQISVETCADFRGRTRLWNDGRLVTDAYGDDSPAKPSANAGIWNVLHEGEPQFADALVQRLETLP